MQRTELPPRTERELGIIDALERYATIHGAGHPGCYVRQIFEMVANHFEHAGRHGTGPDALLLALLNDLSCSAHAIEQVERAFRKCKLADVDLLDAAKSIRLIAAHYDTTPTEAAILRNVANLLSRGEWPELLRQLIVSCQVAGLKTDRPVHMQHRFGAHHASTDVHEPRGGYGPLRGLHGTRQR